MILYLAGPVSSLPRETYRHRFRSATVWLESRGHTVIDPVQVVEEADLQDEPWETIMWLCLQILDAADAIVCLPGWRESLGARLEVGQSVALGLDLYDGVHEVPLAAKPDTITVQCETTRNVRFDYAT